ncbi:acyl-CoA dehydrogenase family protein [Diaphorobacter caeni]|uniref:acyl-CoA dehydrogenase family protein n=1 Tax=Diaphorobacter caeni TaxID=2784387 RepID=UPI00188F2D2A|nr:acyl-CoA dehydrogenase family protein [Diaphorobacter caeni]MBF5005125.1 acyl-CoA dehydrogenase family protein [Diaphorobacter caeni]
MSAPFNDLLFNRDFSVHTGVVESVATQLAATAAQRDKLGGSALKQRQLLRESGLLTLLVPKEFGGQGETWPLILRIVRRLAAADSSMAHLFAFQHLQVATVLLFGTPEQQRSLLASSVEKRWFWGNATNDRDVRLLFEKTAEGHQLVGPRFFCSGSVDAEALIVNVPHPAINGARLFLAVPADRRGVRVGGDWDAFGQRQTDSGSVYFEGTPVEPLDRLGWPTDQPPLPRLPRHSLRSCMAQAILTEIYLGNTEGALEAAREHVTLRARPWPGTGAESASEDGTIQLRFGEHWIAYRGARLIAESAARSLQQAWSRGDALTAQERATVALEVAEARVASAQAGLAVTSGLFDQMGANATAGELALDRYWRNIRVHSLHDPLDLKRQVLGKWLLRGEAPQPSGFS